MVLPKRIDNTPQERFKSYIAYILNEYTYTKSFKGLFIMLLIIIFLIIYSSFTSSDSAILFAFIISFISFFYFIFGILFTIGLRLFKTNEFVRAKFLKEFLRVNPGLDLSLWDSIAITMNTYMLENGYWASPYYFYSGQQCKDFFLDFAIYPYISQSNVNIEMNYLEFNSTENTNSSDNSNEGNVFIDKKIIVQNTGLEKSLKQAQKMYREKCTQDLADV